MFTDVLLTFLKFSVIVIMFIVAFSMGFHCLLANQVNNGEYLIQTKHSKSNCTQQKEFAHGGFSLLKTMVMMLGEVDFGAIFVTNIDYHGIRPSPEMPFPPYTLVCFLVFACVMSIIIMNLMVNIFSHYWPEITYVTQFQVGLAVDDIKSVQDNAVVQRLEMQVHLNLDIEKRLPMWLRRKLTVRGETLHPNKRRSAIVKFLYDDYNLERIAKAVVAMNAKVIVNLLSTQEVVQFMLVFLNRATLRRCKRPSTRTTRCWRPTRSCWRTTS